MGLNTKYEDNIVKYFECFVKGFILEIRLGSKSEKILANNHIEIQNNRLGNILLELAYMLLRLKRPRLSENKKHRDKCLLLLRVPPEEFYEMLFGHEDIIEFLVGEKDYLRKHFFYWLESEVVVEHVKNMTQEGVVD